MIEWLNETEALETPRELGVHGPSEEPESGREPGPLGDRVTMNVSSDSGPNPPSVIDESKNLESYGGRKHNAAGKRKRITIAKKTAKSNSK